jgi:hypothetical protein
MKKRFLLINPEGDINVYEFSSVIKFAKKIYKKLKLNNYKQPYFVIRDVDTNETFNFIIHKNKQNAHNYQTDNIQNANKLYANLENDNSIINELDSIKIMLNKINTKLDNIIIHESKNKNI